MNYPSEQPIEPLPHPSVQVERKRAIAYSMDTLIPGFYCWTPFGNLQIGGSAAEASYPGMVHSRFGVALVLPEYRIFTTYRDSYDPRSTHH
jgi:hypothetical protein